MTLGKTKVINSTICLPEICINLLYQSEIYLGSTAVVSHRETRQKVDRWHYLGLEQTLLFRTTPIKM